MIDRNVIASLRNVSKYYKLYNSPKDRLKEALNPFGKIYHTKFYALKDITMEIGQGDIIGIIGRNGSGKSTLLKIIAGILQPNSGEVTINGRISTLLKLGSGFNPYFTGLENLYFYGTILGLCKEEVNNRLDDILSFADIGEYINQPLRTYSSGMKVRLAFSVAVNINPDILLLDEVFSVGDELFRKKSHKRMKDMFESGKTIIYVSHNLRSVRKLCKRVYFLDKGKILISGQSKLIASLYKKYVLGGDKEKQSILEEIEALKLSGC
jgi:ABC-type polysaccharide/polyol phosphate transport system ATPase subunit